MSVENGGQQPEPSTSPAPPPRRKRGRPSKATPDVCDKICDYLARGLTKEQACALAGTSHDAFEAWEKKNPTLRRRAEANRIFALQEKLENDPKDWKKWAWELERIFPNQFADKSKPVVVNQVTALQGTPPTADPELLA
jgi:hypothetical protein